MLVGGNVCFQWSRGEGLGEVPKTPGLAESGRAHEMPRGRSEHAACLQDAVVHNLLGDHLCIISTSTEPQPFAVGVLARHASLETPALLPLVTDWHDLRDMQTGPPGTIAPWETEIVKSSLLCQVCPANKNLRSLLENAHGRT